MTDRQATWLVLGLAVTATVAIPVGLDEAAWSVIAREWFGGAELYVDVIDNKTPLLLALVGAVDLVPGPFPLARSLGVGALAVTLWVSVQRLVSDRRSARAGGALVVFAAVAGSIGLLTTELLAVTGAVAAMALASHRPNVALALLVVIPGFDPRMVILMPALAWWLMRRRDRGWIVATTLVMVGLAGLAVVVGVPDYRYALVELNVGGSRVEEIEVGRQIIAMIRALLPLVAALIVSGARLRPPPVAAWLTIGGLAAAWLSFRPFEHYWLLAIPGVVAWMTTARWRPLDRSRVVVAVMVAVVPITLETVASHRLAAEEFSGYEAIAPIVAEALGEDGRFVAFDNRPWLPYLVPDRNATRSPLIGYLTTPSSRLQWALDDLALVMMDPATRVIVDDGGLSVDASLVRDDSARVREIIDEHLAKFGCRVDTVAAPTVWVRADACG